MFALFTACSRRRGSARIVRLCVAALSAWIAGACGGRAELTDAPAASGTQAGSSAQAGTSASIGGSNATGGGPSAAGGSTAACSLLQCPPLTCANSLPKLLPGDCCLSCQSFASPECAAGTTTYLERLAGFLDTYQVGCQTDADCTVVLADNRCDEPCDFEAVLVASAGSLKSTIASEALADCSVCPEPGAQPNCGNPPAALCSTGRCYTPKPH
jgi:hypothetical protein